MKNEIVSKLKEIEKENKKLYERIFIVSGLKHKYDYYHIIYDNIIEGCVDNNDLALLGDNVLKLIFSTYLYNKKYSSKENKNIKITIEKGRMESNAKFLEIAKNLNLVKYFDNIFPNYKLPLAKKALATFLEEIFGAFYLHFGFENIKEFIYKNINHFINH